MSSRGRSPRRPGVGAALFVAALGVPGPLVVELGACSRHADLRDDPDGGTLTGNPWLDAGEIPDLDSGLGTDAYPPCETRAFQACTGTVDFPCAFPDWVTTTAEACQLATGCFTNGHLHVTLGADGCVSAVGMTAPNDDMIACLVEEFGAQQCPCDPQEITHFFGLTNTGTCPDGGGPSG